MAEDKGNGERLSPPNEAQARIENRVRHKIQRQPPPSMWTAPQSQIPPPNPDDIPNSARSAKFFRRVAVPHMIDGPPPTRGQRVANILGGVLGCTVGLYLVLLHDFGTPDHAFMPIRRFFSLDPFNPLALTSAEKKWAHEKGIDREKTSDGEQKLV